MDLTIISIVIGFVGLGMRIERRFNRLEAMIKECPHVDPKKAQVVESKAAF